MNPTAHRPGSTRRFDVAIRGTGVVGQTLALLLARDRLRVALIGPTRTESGQPDVRAYALNAASRELLRSVRAWPETGPQDDRAPPITPVTAMQVWGDNGGELAFSAEDQGAQALTWIVDVPALEQRLNDAVGFQSGIERVSEAPIAALTVVCEGKRSQTRAELGLDFDVRPYPHKAIAARLRCDQPHGGVARQWFANGEVMALLPLGGEDGNSVALVWSVPAQQADTWLQADPDTFTQAVQARSAQALGHMHMESPAQAWPLELSRAQRWIARTAQGGVALAGDAAHAMHPLAGQGLNVGLADVAELARVLQQREYWRELGDLKLLRRYERARQGDWLRMSLATDGLQQLFGRPEPVAALLRNWGMAAFDASGPLKRRIARLAMGTA